ncbi:glycosyltransferase family 2 protein [Sulfobacillus thermosulfidooxidans]|uniref:glycosyltransferase family 2 protein n=1 Tax=Sulfobacillus thermosulfidooxidans TaxID=28034 RepID=UPI0003195D39|nr:glycosyltransferase family 2 protein [Sulfobacillus thermosulfidooxidans]
MLNGKKIVVVLPAYNAETTLRRTVQEIDRSIIDEVLLVDDHSTDATSLEAKKLGIPTIRHEINRGYGGNQKTCYNEALRRNADVVIMLHPDYQYTPQLLVAMAGMIAYGTYDVVLASRILGRGALKGGMPLYKYVFNRILTFAENILIGLKLSEYHTGYRAFSRDVLMSLPLHLNSDDFIFDNQIIAQAHFHGFRIGEISCPTRYEPDSSSINFRRSVIYGLGVMATALQYRLNLWRLWRNDYLTQVQTNQIVNDTQARNL